MHKPKLVLENETHKILWDFKIQTDHLITTRRPARVIVTKKRKEKKYKEREPTILWTLPSQCDIE